MKVYNLTCEHDHRFEGWFSSEEDYVAQSEVQQIACPMCDNRVIRKLPSAPRLSLSGSQSEPQDEKLQIQKQIMNVVRHIIANTEDVGARFAEEARRIHYKETPERAIRGTATVQEFEALSEEGVDVMPFSVPETIKQPLQ